MSNRCEIEMWDCWLTNYNEFDNLKRWLDEIAKRFNWMCRAIFPFNKQLDRHFQSNVLQIGNSQRRKIQKCKILFIHFDEMKSPENKWKILHVNSFADWRIKWINSPIWRNSNKRERWEFNLPWSLTKRFLPLENDKYNNLGQKTLKSIENSFDGFISIIYEQKSLVRIIV